ncbi:MAG TPA: endonuclease/exonuclease/phosphatase family protein [Solirubrobacterales bacterium]|nr:endonuclease/exonuclease/phosphatase family protein [Solirubrobacterales bacterium]
MILTTWNMQGGNATTEVKWQTGVANILANSPLRPDAICLQEAGGVPDSARLLGVVSRGPVSGRFFDPLSGTTRVSVYQWGGTRTRPGHTIFHHEWDDQGNRVNTALVTYAELRPPFDIELSWAGEGPTWRPALGILLRGAWIFSFHAISPNGADAAAVLARVADGAAGTDWYVGGDFNRDPMTLIPLIPANSVACEPSRPTHPVKNPSTRKDYFVRSGIIPATGTVEANITYSDHFPVEYAF